MRIVQGLFAFVTLVVLGFSAAPAQQQRNPLAGTWSMQVHNPTGSGVVFTTFNEDGRFTQRWVIPMRNSDYSGTYQLAADGSSLQWTYRDYNPKDIPPMIQLNTPVTTYIQWISPNIFLTQDGGGTNRWVRNP
jgi:hypothetical protein